MNTDEPPRRPALTPAEPARRPALTPVVRMSDQCRQSQERLQSAALQALEGTRQATEEIARLMKEALASEAEARQAEREARRTTSEALLEALREESRRSERLLAASGDLAKALRESDERFQKELTRHSDQMERLVSWLVPAREQRTTSPPLPPVGGSVPCNNLTDAENAPPSKAPCPEGASNSARKRVSLSPRPEVPKRTRVSPSHSRK